MKHAHVVRSQFFSLVELLIVIAIMGALTALILPQFTGTEKESKRSACKYNSSGTQRYISTFKSINGVFPSKLHSCGHNGTLLPQATGNLTNNAADNFTALSVNEAKSLVKAGIVALAEAAGTGDELWRKYAEKALVAADGTMTAKTALPKVIKIKKDEVWKEGAEEVTIRGKHLHEYVVENSKSVAVLFVSPATDWENVYKNENSTASGQSKFTVPLVGQAPIDSSHNTFAYYGLVLELDETGQQAARLLGVICPECGSLNP